MSAAADPWTRAANWLAAWDAHGDHRTATKGDKAGAEFLAREAASLGADVTVEEFAVERLDPVTAFLEIDGERIPAIPAFDAPATGSDGIGGRLGPVGSGAEIVVAELPPQAVYSGEYERLRSKSGHCAFVVLCAGQIPGMALLNAERFRDPFGKPAIHVSSAARERVLAAAAQQRPARLVSESRRTAASARNIVISLDTGGRRTAAPLVVMTPRSSWWQSTAERGGGIVCWLETLRALLAAGPSRPPSRPIVFTANSGHELGHLGLDDFIARRPGWDRTASDGGALWVHYGANIGASGGTLSLVSPDTELRALATAELTHAGQEHALASPDLVPSGETRDIHHAGGRYLTLVGTNPLFHLPQDRWLDAVDVASIARIAAAASRIVLTLARA
ncbi:MAG: hypothetical protein AB7H90_23540 [Alphaproteobacteria bacterium]